jgi:hypothetical protein
MPQTNAHLARLLRRELDVHPGFHLAIVAAAQRARVAGTG